MCMHIVNELKMVTCRKTVGPEAQYEHAAQYKDGQEVLFFVLS